MIDSTLTFLTAAVTVILSAAVLGFLYRKRQKQSHILQLLAYQSLGPKKGVAALKVGQEVLLLGVMSGGIRLLKTLEAGEILTSEERSFSEHLERLRKLKEEIHE